MKTSLEEEDTNLSALEFGFKHGLTLQQKKENLIILFTFYLHNSIRVQDKDKLLFPKLKIGIAVV